MSPLKIISFLLSFYLLVSCSNRLDFNQIEDFSYHSEFTGSLIYFKAIPEQFFDAPKVLQQNSISDTLVMSNLTWFENNFIIKQVTKIVFNADLRNVFDRDVIVQIEFLDNNGIIYAFTPIHVSNNNPDFLSFEEEILIAANPNVLSLSKVRITLELEDTGTQMNPNSLDEFEFKSAVTLLLGSNIEE
jgi:hypothetical protein